MTIHVVQARNNLDREGIYRFLYDIWSGEFGRNMEGMDHEHRLMKDALDETAHHFTAVDESGRIMGCARANILDRTLLPENIRRHLKQAELVDLFGREELCYASHFTIAPEARGKTVASLLIAALYRFYLNKGISIGISYCALNFVSFYYQLGYRPYAENFRLDAGIRVPIVHCIRDWAYLREIKSPLARLSSSGLDDQGAAARKMAGRFPAFTNPSFFRSKVHHLWARLAHTGPTRTAVGKNALFAGLSEEEQRIVGHRLSEIAFFQGEYVYRDGETEQGMGVLISGCLGVEISVGGVARVINVILPGEPFGEISSLGGGRRAASLVALEKSQAVLFPFDFLERVCRADTELGLKLAKRLLKTLATRFVNLADAVVHGAGSADASPQVKGLSRDADADATKGRTESYRFETLGDR